MRHLLYALFATARSSLKSQRELALENLALRQQLAVLKRTTKRCALTKADRAANRVFAAPKRKRLSSELGEVTAVRFTPPPQLRLLVASHGLRHRSSTLDALNQSKR
jgi:hypothetical protein